MGFTRDGQVFTSVAPKLGSRPALDGLRGIGVMIVVLGHVIYEVIPSAAALVDMFFLLSGFLIPTLLLEEHRKTDSVDLKRFYKRRAMRLLPMLYIVVGVTFASLWALYMIHGATTAAPFSDGGTYGDLWDMVRSDALAAGTYMYHVIHPVGEELVHSTMPTPRPLIPLWTLGVEEHYYIVGVLLTFLAIKRHWIRPAIGILASAIVFIAIARALGHVGPRLAWYQRPDALLAGVVIAFVNAYIPESFTNRHERGIKRVMTASIVAWCGIVFLGTWFAKPFNLWIPFHPLDGAQLADGLYWPRFGFSAALMCSVCLVWGLARTRGHWSERMLSASWLCAVGRRSYGIYIIHFPLAMILLNLFPGTPAVGVLLYLPMLWLTTELAHRYLEKPLMTGRAPLKSPPAEAPPGTRADELPGHSGSTPPSGG